MNQVDARLKKHDVARTRITDWNGPEEALELFEQPNGAEASQPVIV